MILIFKTVITSTVASLFYNSIAYQSYLVAN